MSPEDASATHGRPVGVKAVYTVRPKRALGALGRRPAGVVVYAMPNPRIELRTIATNGVFHGLDRQTELELLNRHVRCLARVVIEPRFRGIGLAVRLVRETMPRLNVPIIEALGVMALVYPFLERAGMRCFEPRVPVEHVELLEALSAVGIERDGGSRTRAAATAKSAAARRSSRPDAAASSESRSRRTTPTASTDAVRSGQADTVRHPLSGSIHIAIDCGWRIAPSIPQIRNLTEIRSDWSLEV
jgi:hypothetical protein